MLGLTRRPRTDASDVGDPVRSFTLEAKRDARVHPRSSTASLGYGSGWAKRILGSVTEPRSELWTRRVGAGLGITYLALGIAESIAHSDEPGSLVFWAPALLGGGTLVLLGVFVVREPGWLSTSLVGVGLLAATLATAWTIILPLAAIGMFVLVAMRSATPSSA
jgi:hypothetical protein